jgi:SAM-dependent methyltransferase
VADDKQTRDYFDKFTPHFNPKRFQFALDFLNANADPSQKLIDIGCGDGATLAMIRDATPLTDLTGLDVSSGYLEKARASLGCHTVHGSVIDEELVKSLEGRFDYAVMGAVLHHIIEPTRSASRHAADTAVRNAFRLLKPGGRLILFEPTFRPRWAMFLVFWAKKLIGSVTSERLHLGPAWANLGQPVVSYYTDAEVAAWVRRQDPAAEAKLVDRSRLAGLIERRGIAMIAPSAS